MSFGLLHEGKKHWQRLGTLGLPGGGWFRPRDAIGVQGGSVASGVLAEGKQGKEIISYGMVITIVQKEVDGRGGLVQGEAGRQGHCQFGVSKAYSMSSRK
eukprot:6480934-Amphidinium_carterae.1